MSRGEELIVGIVVARVGSTRVPGKSLLEVCGHPLVWHIIENTGKAKKLDRLCLATSSLPADDPLEEIARECEVECVRGDAERVLDRVHQAARHCRADIVVDVGGDCPFIHPRLLDEAISHFLDNRCDYLCNYEPPTFPEGFDINILTMDALDAAYRRALAPSQRIHPFSYLTRHRDQFRIENYTMAPDLSRYHWSLDFPEDVEFVQCVFERLYRPDRPIDITDILDLVERDPEIGKMNEHLIRPPALHAFWNSPGMMRDMNEDIVALSRMAQDAGNRKDFRLASLCYREILSISAELQRHADHAGNQS